MQKTVAMKMGVAEGSRTFLKNAPEEAVKAINLPEVKVAARLSGMFDYIHLFVTKEKDFIKQFPRLKAHLAENGRLWVSWPKNKKLDTDLNIKVVIRNGYDFGLVESTALSVDDTWSALKFTHPKEGKKYNNSYGKLPEKA